MPSSLMLLHRGSARAFLGPEDTCTALRTITHTAGDITHAHTTTPDGSYTVSRYPDALLPWAGGGRGQHHTAAYPNHYARVFPGPDQRFPLESRCSAVSGARAAPAHPGGAPGPRPACRTTRHAWPGCATELRVSAPLPGQECPRCGRALRPRGVSTGTIPAPGTHRELLCVPLAAPESAAV